MLKPEQVPDAVVKAFEEEYHFGEGDWKRNCLAAALNAWPGVTTTSWFENGVRKAVLNIPLPQEASDE